MAGNIARTYDGMMIAIPEEEWIEYRAMTKSKFNDFILKLGSNVNISKFNKSRRGAKKPIPKRTKYKGHPHVSTEKLLRGIEPNKKKKKTP